MNAPFTKLCSKCKREPIANGSRGWGRNCLNEAERERAEEKAAKKKYNPTPAEILAFHKPWGSHAEMKRTLEPIP